MKPGDQLGPYTIQRALASGGMGSVYLARDDAGARVAIKTVNIESASQLMALRREIRALLSIDHPTIVSVREHGLYDALPWFAMEFIEGVSLRQHLDDADATQLLETLPRAFFDTPTIDATSDAAIPMWTAGRPDEATRRILLEYLATILRGLGFLHAAGIVHRDLKPDNIVVRLSGAPVLVDFGIATHAGGGREKLTRAAEFAGTPAYMAPEQVNGTWIDARADIYAIGCILYEIVSGRPPFLGDSVVEILTGHVMHPVPPLDDVDPRLTDLITRLLAKNPEDRPAYAHDVARELESILGLDIQDQIPAVHLYRPPLVGRDAQLARCEVFLDEVRAGRGGILCIAGQPGSGKTRFANELAARVSMASDLEGLLVEVSADSHNPFAAVLSEFADICRDQGPVYTRRCLGDEGAILSKLFRPLLALPGMEEYEPPADLPPKLEALRRTRAWMTIVQRMWSGRPVIIIIDQSNPDLMVYLSTFRQAQDLAAVSIGIFVTVDASLKALEEFPKQRIVELSPLVDSQVDTLISSSLSTSVPPTANDFLRRRGRGNPALINAYLRLAVDRGLIHRTQGEWQVEDDTNTWNTLPPPDDEQQVSEALEALSSTARELLEICAVYGAEVPISVMEQWLEAPEDFEELDPLLERDLLTLRDDRLGISDPVLHVALRALDSDRLRILHHRVAESLQDPMRQAEHFLDAGEPERAQELFLDIAERAYRDKDKGSAWRALRRYFELPTNDSPRVVKAYLMFTQLTHRTGRVHEVRAVASAGSEMAERLGMRDERNLLRGFVAWGMAVTDQPGAIELAREIVEDARGTLVESNALNALGAILERTRELEETCAAYERAFSLRDREEDPSAYVEFGIDLASSLISLNRYERALTVLETISGFASDHGLAHLEAYIMGNLGIIVGDELGDFELALSHFEKAEALHAAAFDRVGEAQALVARAVFLSRSHRFDEAIAVGQTAVMKCVEAGLGAHPLAKIKITTARALIGKRDYEAVRSVIDEAKRSDLTHDARNVLATIASSPERRLGHPDRGLRELESVQDVESGQFSVMVRYMVERAFVALALGLDYDRPPESEHQSKGITGFAYRMLQRAESARERGESLWFGEPREAVLYDIPDFQFEDEPALEALHHRGDDG